MTRVEALEIIKLLSALIVIGPEKLPDYLIDQIAASIEVLEKEVLK